MKRWAMAVLAVAAVGGGAYWYLKYEKQPEAPTVATAAVTRGDIVETVGATGTLQAVTTVQVGTQVSGTIQSLYADFNSLVKKGQVLARLDPSLFQTQIEQARANLIRAQADLERLRVALSDAQTKLARARELSNRQLIPRTDLETAEVNVRSAEAQIRSADAQVTQAQASLNQNQVNLEHTVITAPIDGLVISRSVDVGQTVAASMQAPTLFLLAADLTKMQVVANLDESDVGRIRPKQVVTFRVDAYPSDMFRGTVSQVRLEPKVQQNVVTYATVIDVANNDLKLKPGMTANVNVEIARADNVLRVPNAALRFRPTTEIFTALGQTPPEPTGRGFGPGGSAEQATPRGAAGASGEGSEPAAKQAAAGTAQPTGTQGGRTPAAAAADGRTPPQTPAGPETGGRGRLAERLQAMSPDERTAAIARMRERGFDPGALANVSGDAPASAPAPKSGRGATGGAARAGSAKGSDDILATTSATTIDALFAPLPRTESVGRAWVQENGQLRPVRLRLGISDGQTTEIVGGDIAEGAELVTSVTLPGQSTRPPATALPFGQPGRGGFPAGSFQGGANRGTGAGATRR